MQKKFLYNLILLLAVNLIIKPLTILGVDTEVQNRMGVEDYGIYFTLFNFTTIFNILLDLGINSFTTRNVAQHPHILKKYMGSILILRGILIVVYLLFCIFLGYIIGYNSAMIPLLILFSFQQITYNIISYSRAYLTGLMLFKEEALLSILDKLLVLIVCGSLLYAGVDFNFTIYNYISVQLICNGIAAFVSIYLLMRRIGKVEFKWRRPLFHFIIRQSLPYALFVILMMLYTRMDSVMVERLHPNGNYESGIYAQGFRLVDAGFMFAMLFGSLLLPIFSKIHKDKEESKKLVMMASKLLIWPAIGISMIVYFYADQILNFLYIHVAQNGVELFQVQFFTFVFMCGTVLFGTFLTGVGDMRLLNYIGLLGLVTNFGLNLILIPYYGAMGAAISTLVTQSAVTLIQYWQVKRFTGMSLNWVGLIKLVFFTSLIGVFSFLSLDWTYGLALSISFTVFLFFVFKVIDVKAFVQLVKGGK